MSFFGLMTVKAHRESVASWASDLAATHARLTNERNAETLRANALAAELAHWKANAQLRDPKTGRLIPREKGVV